MRKYIDLIIGIAIFFYCTMVNIISNRIIAFSETLGFLGILLIIYHFSKIKLKSNKYFIKVNQILVILVSVGFIIFIFSEAMIIGYPKNNEESTDYIMILGAGLNDGDRVSLTLKHRLDAALKYINESGSKSYLVVSGGQGLDETISESEAMKRYLIKNGVPSDKIIKEDKSTNTYENFKYSKEKIEEHSRKNIDKNTVKIVTTDFHALRSSMLAKRNGYDNINVYSSKTVSYLVPIFYTRESLALAKSFILDR